MPTRQPICFRNNIFLLRKKTKAPLTKDDNYKKKVKKTKTPITGSLKKKK
jgi:hypothetical protein